MCFRCSFFHVPNFRFKGPRDKVDKHKAQRYNAANVVMIVGDPRIGVENFQSFSDSGPSVFSVSCLHFSTFYHPFVLLHLLAACWIKLDQPISWLVVAICPKKVQVVQHVFRPSVEKRLPFVFMSLDVGVECVKENCSV